MAETIFYLTDLTYKVVAGAAVIYLYGRTPDGEQVCVKDPHFKPYFYVKAKEDITEKLNRLNVEQKSQECVVTKVERVKKKLREKETQLLKVYTNIPKAVPVIKDIVRDWDAVASVHEYDILFTRRYLIDKGLTPMTLVKAVGEKTVEKSKVKVITATSIEQYEENTFTKPRILAVDIETYNPSGKRLLPEEYPIIMLAVYGDTFKKVLTYKKFATKDKTIEFVPSEADLLERFKELVEEYEPDLIAGYYSDGFDFPYIKTRAAKYKIKMDLGLDYSELKIAGQTRQEASIVGIPHFDVFKFIRRSFARTLQTDTYSLDAVSKELLGEQKTPVDIEKLAQFWDEGSQKLELFCVYNLQDTKLTYDLAIKVLPNILEIVKIVGQPLLDINRMSFSQYVEWYAIKQAAAFNEVALNRPGYREKQARMQDRIKGAFVFEPQPGLYEDIAIFDYRSLYPTIIASHNISPGMLNCSCCEGKKLLKTDRGNFWFCSKRKGFVSTIIEDLITRRARIKEMMKKGDPHRLLAARSDVLKVLANSFYGYLGFSASRWYSIESAESTTAFARQYVKDLITKATEAGFKVLYGDTDSAFMTLDGKTEADAKKFAEAINKHLPGLMEVEYEGYYPAGLFVSTKSSETGAKKRYALMDAQDNMKIVGFEMVRRNVSPIAKTVQQKVLKTVLKQKEADEALHYTKQVVKDLRNNALPIADMVIHTALSKDISEYESTGPHVAAAQRMKDKGQPVGAGSFIDYVVVKGKGRIRDKVRLPEEITQSDYDGEYYIKHQVLPAVDRIFAVFGINVDEYFAEKKQTGLGEFL